jgi:hypothetical protein
LLITSLLAVALLIGSVGVVLGSGVASFPIRVLDRATENAEADAGAELAAAPAPSDHTSAGIADEQAEAQSDASAEPTRMESAAAEGHEARTSVAVDEPAVVMAAQAPVEPVKASLATTSRTFSVPRFVHDPAGASSGLAIFNPGTKPVAATIRVRDATGRELLARPLTIPIAGQGRFAAEEVAARGVVTGSATVSADGEIAVAVEERQGTTVISYEATGWPGAEVAFPLVPRGATGSTLIAMQNVTDRPGTVTATFSVAAGAAPITAAPIAVPPFGAATLDLATVPGLPPTFSGSARLDAGDVAIAATLLTTGPAGASGAYAGFARGTERLAIPGAAVTSGGPSRVVLQNLADLPAELLLERRKASDQPPPPVERRSLARGTTQDVGALGVAVSAHESLVVAGPRGSHLVAVAQVPGGFVPAAPATTTQHLVPAAVLRSGVLVQNYGEEKAQVAVLALDADGDRVGARTAELEAGATLSVAVAELRLPPNFGGAVVVAGTQPIGVVVR